MRIRAGACSSLPLFAFVGLALGFGFPAHGPAQQSASQTTARLLPIDDTGSEVMSRVAALPEPIVNGVLDWGNPSVGYMLDVTTAGECTGTLIGCRTFLTAAHCICTDDDETLSGADCAERADLVDPATKLVFFQHAGIFGVSDITVQPDFLFGSRSDLAILELGALVAGVRSSRINQVGRPPIGSQGAIVGFGLTVGGGSDSGLKRAGQIETAACSSGIPGSTHICWNFLDPVGPPGSDSNTCPGDSGGPLFFNFGGGDVVGGVTSGGTLSTCLQGDHSFDADAFVDRAWIAGVAGADLHRTDCGPLAFAGEPGGSILAGGGDLSAGNPESRFSFDVPPGLSRVLVSLNGPLSTDFDLFIRRNGQPTTSSFDCSSENVITLETCIFETPQAGTYHILVNRFDGAGEFQVTATLFESASDGGGNGSPPPPAGPWLSSPELPGFEAKVLINDTTPGSEEADCIPETLCASGALAGRPEIFVKVIGQPNGRPNGFLWSQVSRFTPSKVEVWLRQISTGQINYYELAAVGPAEDNVSGLQDREAFSP